jgi:hypothetical protein
MPGASRCPAFFFALGFRSRHALSCPPDAPTRRKGGVASRLPFFGEVLCGGKFLASAEPVRTSRLRWGRGTEHRAQRATSHLGDEAERLNNPRRGFFFCGFSLAPCPCPPDAPTTAEERRRCLPVFFLGSPMWGVNFCGLICQHKCAARLSRCAMRTSCTHDPA